MPQHTFSIHNGKPEGLKGFLDDLYVRYSGREYLYSDPLEFVHRYEAQGDQEVVGLLSALLAYGNVKQIKKSVADLLQRIESTGLRPRQFILKTSFDAPVPVFRGFVHRFHTGEDIRALCWLVKRSIEKHGSLGAHFSRGISDQDTQIENALRLWMNDWKSDYKSIYLAQKLGKPTRSFMHFLSSPEGGSTCKRWCMYLRWMGRKDELDLGIWQQYGLRSDLLVMPLDTHTARLSRELRLSRRKNADWKMAIEVTDRLKKLDPKDPIRYDFAICRLGIIEKAS